MNSRLLDLWDFTKSTQVPGKRYDSGSLSPISLFPEWHVWELGRYRFVSPNEI